MKRIVIAVATALAIAPAFAQQWDGPYYGRDRYNAYNNNNSYPVQREEYARVVDAQPVYVSSREECWNPRSQAYEERRENRNRIGAGTAAGAIAGGVIGNQIEHGSGTVAGALLGGLVGHEIERRNRSDDDLDLSRCRVASDSTGVEGYDVRYRYRGNEYVTRMASDPGSRLLLGRDINSDGTPFG